MSNAASNIISFQAAKHEILHPFQVPRLLLTKTTDVRGENSLPASLVRGLRENQENSPMVCAILNSMVTQNIRFCWITKPSLEALINNDVNYSGYQFGEHPFEFKLTNHEYREFLNWMVRIGHLRCERVGFHRGNKNFAAVYQLLGVNSFHLSSEEMKYQLSVAMGVKNV